DLIGHGVDELVSADEHQSTTLDEDGVAHYTGTGHRLDGSTFPEEVDVRWIEVGGEPRMLAIVRDLTERSRLQAELVQAQKMEAIGLLVAGVAHELNNPLASIVAFSQLLRTDPDLPTDLRTQADLLVQEANRTRVIVGNLLDFARQRPPERVETDLRQLVDGILGLQSYMLNRDRLTVVVDIPDHLPRLELDRSQFQQVLVNLTVNAAQAIHELDRPGRIEIRARYETRANGPIVRLTIADDGPGVPAEVADRLFMPFVSSKSPGEGTGLGLSVSFGIVAAHGGTIHHESNASGGATFVIELPVSEGVASEPGRPHESALPALPIASAAAAGAALDDLVDVAAHALAQAPSLAPGRSSAGRSAGGRAAARPRILVLDDELAIRDFLGRVLARAGYEPVLAASGDEALAIVRSNPPAAVLCDHRMAGMSGTAFQAAVAALDPKLGRRFAFMSGDVLNPELRTFATEHGVHLLAKPFDISTVDETVRALLATPPAA
ncbi:MAG TPA: ATP-binding protein, partial [Candidatus Limnocylindrales bacterium]